MGGAISYLFSSSSSSSSRAADEASAYDELPPAAAAARLPRGVLSSSTPRAVRARASSQGSVGSGPLPGTISRRFSTLSPISAAQPGSPAPRHGGKPRGLVGLHNVGNTCFMNSCLQCVANVPPLTDLVLSRELHINTSSATSRTRGQVVKAWADLMARMWRPDGGGAGRAETPSELKRVVASIAPRFLGYDQHDSQEFLVFLLDALADDTNVNARKAEYRELAERASDTDATVAAEWWAYMRSHCDSRLRDLVTGQLKSSVRCGTCGHVARAFDTFTTLSLPIPRAAGGGGGGGAGCSLADCLRAFTAPEELAGADALYCARCKAHSSGVKTMTLFQLPPVLILHLKRFASVGHRRSKLDTRVAFPADGLDMAEYLPPLQGGGRGGAHAPTTYHCVGVSNHAGSLSGGHYTADVRNRDDNLWYHCNDSHVSDSEMRDGGAAAGGGGGGEE